MWLRQTQNDNINGSSMSLLLVNSHGVFFSQTIWNNRLYGLVCHFTQLLNICVTQFFLVGGYCSCNCNSPTYELLFTCNMHPLVLLVSQQTIGRNNFILPNTWLIQKSDRMIPPGDGANGLGSSDMTKIWGRFSKYLWRYSSCIKMCAFNIRIQLGLKCVFIISYTLQSS